MKTILTVLERADAVIAKAQIVQHRDFFALIDSENAKFASGGALGGSDYRKRVHGLCAVQLHYRIRLALDALWHSHTAASAPPSDECRRVCKDWIALRINGEAEDLQQHMLWPHPGYASAGRNDNPLDNLMWEARHELRSANAEIDNRMAALRQDLVQRGVRLLTRGYAGLRLLMFGVTPQALH